MNLLDPIGASLSLISTYYFTHSARRAWIVGAAAIIINSILYWQKGIYGAMLLEGVYLLSMLYGWIVWSTRKTTLIRYLSFAEKIGYCLLAIMGSMALGLILDQLTDSTIAYWDSTTTVLSLIAQWLLCRKVIHCWILWLVVDVMVAGLQFYKGIPFHSAIHILYLGFAISGYLNWTTLYRQQRNSSAIA